METENYTASPPKRRDHRSPLYKLMGQARTPLGAIALVAAFSIPVILIILAVSLLI
jgi:hypothetical protein